MLTKCVAYVRAFHIILSANLRNNDRLPSLMEVACLLTVTGDNSVLKYTVLQMAKEERGIALA